MEATPVEEVLERFLFSLSSLGEIGEMVTREGGFGEETKFLLLRMILGTMRVSKGAILLYNPETSSLAIEAANGIEDENLKIPLELSEARCLASYSIINFSESNTHLADFIEKNETALAALGAYIWAPLVVGEVLLGVISLGKVFTGVDFEKWDLELLSVIANHTAIAIHNVHLLEGMRWANLQEKQKVLMLNQLAEISAQISSLMDTEELKEQILNNAIILSDARAGCIMLIDKYKNELRMERIFGLDESLSKLSLPLGEDILGKAAAEGKFIVENDAKEHTVLGCETLLIAPILGQDEILGILVVCDKEGLEGLIDFKEVDEMVLSALANQAGVALVNAQLYAEALERRRMQAEMEAAAEIQRNLLPDAPPKLEGYEIDGMNVQRGKVGGDYYDYIMEGENQLGIVIGDVSGKGMQAALLMATLRAGVLEIAGQVGPDEIVDRLNNLLYKSTTMEKYATFFYGSLDLKTGVLKGINAGHNYPIIARTDGTCEYIKEHSTPLGMFPQDIFSTVLEESQEVQLRPGDIVLIYTDGVTDTVNINDESFGEERVIEAIAKYREGGAEEIMDGIYEEICKFQGEAEQFDDLTLVVLKVNSIG